MDPTYVNIQAEDLEAILAKEIALEESLFFKNLTIDPRSLYVKPSDEYSQATTTTVATTLASTKQPEPPRQCSPVELGYCNRLTYNFTTYPNVFMHKSTKDVVDNVIPFRELVSFKKVLRFFQYSTFLYSSLNSSTKLLKVHFL